MASKRALSRRVSGLGSTDVVLLICVLLDSLKDWCKLCSGIGLIPFVPIWASQDWLWMSVQESWSWTWTSQVIVWLDWECSASCSLSKRASPCIDSLSDLQYGFNEISATFSFDAEVKLPVPFSLSSGESVSTSVSTAVWHSLLAVIWLSSFVATPSLLVSTLSLINCSVTSAQVDMSLSQDFQTSSRLRPPKLCRTSNWAAWTLVRRLPLVELLRRIAAELRLRDVDLLFVIPLLVDFLLPFLLFSKESFLRLVTSFLEVSLLFVPESMAVILVLFRSSFISTLPPISLRVILPKAFCASSLHLSNLVSLLLAVPLSGDSSLFFSTTLAFRFWPREMFLKASLASNLAFCILRRKWWKKQNIFWWDKKCIIVFGVLGW